MKKTHLFKNLFTTTLLSTLALSNIEIVNAASVTYNNANSNSTIATDPLPFNQITFNSVSNITIAGAVNAFYAVGQAISMTNSSPIFDNIVNVTNSSVGIISTNSNSIFNQQVIIDSAPIQNFSGSIIFKAPVTVNNSYISNGGITMSTAVITFDDDIFLNNNIGMKVSGTVTMNQNVIGVNSDDRNIIFENGASLANIIFNNDTILSAHILANSANVGKITFNGVPTVNGTIGSVASRVANVTFASNDFTKRASLNKDMTASTIQFGGLKVGIDNHLTLTAPSGITTNSTVFDLTKDLTLSGAMTDGTGGGITISGAGTLKIAGSNTINTAIKATANGNGNLEFTGGPTINQQLGTSGVNLASVTFSAGSGTATLNKDIYANSIILNLLTIRPSAAITLNASITTNNIAFDLTNFPLTIAGNFTDIGTGIRVTGTKVLTFSGDNIIDGRLAPSVNGNGTVDFTGAPTTKSITYANPHFSLIKFSSNDPNKRASLNGDIYADAITLGGLKIGVDSNLTLYGYTITTNNTIFDLSKDLTMTGNFSGWMIDGSGGGITITGPGILKINTGFGTHVLNTVITPVSPNNGNVEFLGSSLINKILGGVNNNLASVAFSAGAGNTATLNKDIHANIVEFGGLNVTVNTPLTITAPVKTNTTKITLNQNLTLDGAMTDGSGLGISLTGIGILKITGNNVIGTAIKATANGNGNVEFLGGPTINQPLGASGVNLASVAFSAGAGNTATLNKDIHANIVTFGGLTIKAGSDLVFSSPIKTNNTILDLTDHSLKFSGAITDNTGNGLGIVGTKDLTLGGNNPVNIVIKPTIDNGLNGNIVFTDEPTINTTMGTASLNLASFKLTNIDNTKRASIKNNIYAYKSYFEQLTVGIDGPVTISMPVITNNTTIDLVNNLTISNNLTNSDANGFITLTGNGKLIFNFDNVIDAAIVPKLDGSGNIEFTGGPTIEKKLGDPLLRLNSVEFSDNNPLAKVSLKSDIHAKSIEFGGLQVKIDGIVNLNGDIKIGGGTIFDLSNNGLTIGHVITDTTGNDLLLKGENDFILSGSNPIDFTIKSVGTTDEGNVIFTDDPTINVSLGTISNNLKSVKFSNTNAATVASIQGNIYSQRTDFDKLTVKMSGPVEIYRDVFTSGTSFDLSNGSLTINSNLTDASAGINLTGNQPLKFNFDNVIDAAIVPKLDGSGNIEFTGGPTIEKKLGDPLLRLNSVEFSDNNPLTKLSLKSEIHAKSIEFGGLQVKIDGVMGLYGDVITNNTIFDLTGSGLVIDGKLTNADANGVVTIKGGELLKIDGDNIIDAKIVPNVNGVGEIEFTGGVTITKPVGDLNVEFNVARFKADNTKVVTLNDTVHAQNIEFGESTVKLDTAGIELNGEITTNGTSFDVSGNSLTITNNLTDGSVNKEVIIKGDNPLIFDGNNVINAKLMPEITESSVLRFTGEPVLNYEIGSPAKKFSLVEFSNNAANAKIMLNNNIYTKSNTIVFGKQIVMPGQNIELVGRVSTSNTTFDLVDKVITIDGNLEHNDANGGVIINTTYDGVNAGHFELVGGTSVDLTNSSSLIFNVTETVGTPLPTAGNPRRIDMFVGGGALSFVPNNQVLINSAANPSDKFVKWSFDPVDGALIETLIVPPEEIIPIIIGGGGTPNVNIISKINPNLTADLANLGINEGQEALTEALERLSFIAVGNPGDNLALIDSTDAVLKRTEVRTRLTAFNEEMSGVSAGSADDSKYGAWFTPFYGQNIQKLRKAIPGYKSTYYGGVIGFDGSVNDRIVLGAAFSAINTKVKHTDQNVGDKTTIDTNIIYVYGAYELNNQWYIQNVTSLGSNQIKNRELRREFQQYNIASANFKTKFVSNELITGYSYQIKQDIRVTPTIGLNYSQSSNINYQERGTNNQNLIVKARGARQIEAIAGVSVEGSYIFSNGVKINPEIHGNFDYLLLSRKSKIDVRQVTQPEVQLESRNAKPSKYSYSIGAVLNNQVINEQWNYSIGYDCKLSDKFIAHQATLKLRVLF